MRLFEDFKDAENPGESTVVQHTNLIMLHITLNMVLRPRPQGESEYLLSKGKVKHDRAWSPKWMGDPYVLGFAPALRFLQSQILCRLYKKFFG